MPCTKRPENNNNYLSGEGIPSRFAGINLLKSTKRRKMLLVPSSVLSSLCLLLWNSQGSPFSRGRSILIVHFSSPTCKAEQEQIPARNEFPVVFLRTHGWKLLLPLHKGEFADDKHFLSLSFSSPQGMKLRALSYANLQNIGAEINPSSYEKHCKGGGSSSVVSFPSSPCVGQWSARVPA